MDTILIEALRIDALIGVYPHERQAPQPLLFDIRIGYDNRVPAASDDVADTLDYAAACARVRALVTGSTPQLLETLAEAVAADLLRIPGARGVRLRIRKPLAAQALGAGSVGVEIARDAVG